MRTTTTLVSAVALVALSGCRLDLLEPAGAVGVQERTLILSALGLMLLVVVPVIVLTLVFAWRYRATNARAVYAPKWAHSTAIEVVVWTVPCLIVAALAVMIWRTTQTLDPYRPLESSVKPVRVDVIALDWKWLFVYPDYGVASVNELAIPVGTPVDFRLTAASMMNSFFIPRLGSQVYAMAGMQTQLHLRADEPGTYLGMSASFSGEGFSDMHFKTVATTRAAFDEWIRRAKESPRTLDAATYRVLEQPSQGMSPVTYGAIAPDLFEGVVNRFMRGPQQFCLPSQRTSQVAAAAPRSIN
jgi:cytochrome o ubiquinol oxidase subunit 2